jgi:hypothetical protein
LIEEYRNIRTTTAMTMTTGRNNMAVLLSPLPGAERSSERSERG